MSFTRWVLCFLMLLAAMKTAFATNDTFGFMTRGYNIYGASTRITIAGYRFQMVMRGDTDDDAMRGVGVFDGDIEPTMRSELAEAIATAPRDERGSTPTSYVDPYVKYFFMNGVRRAKLDVVPKISLTGKGSLLITLQFRNAGQEAVVIEHPRFWEGKSNRILGSSAVVVVARRNSANGPTNDQFIIDSFGGESIVDNEANSGQSILTIPAGQTRAVEFSVYPTEGFKKGTYVVNASVSIKNILAPELLKGTVEFSSLDGEAAFERDYPSTPEEIRAFSAYLKSTAQ